MSRSKREPCYSVGYTPPESTFSTAVARLLDFLRDERLREDADAHAEDVWHTRYDGVEDVRRDG